MRIVSGRYKGRTIVPPKGFNARPTTDFAKESLFNILANRYDFEELTVLDLFSGTGGISFEFASRGAQHIDLVEANLTHIAFIKKMAVDLQFTQLHAVKYDAFQFLKSCKATYDIIFADPPYEEEQLALIPQLVFEKGLLRPEGTLIVEHSKQKDLSKLPRFAEHRNYGSVNFTFFE